MARYQVRRPFTWRGHEYHRGDEPPPSLMKRGVRQGQVFLEHGLIVEQEPPESYTVQMDFVAHGQRYGPGDMIGADTLPDRTLNSLMSRRKIKPSENGQKVYTCETCGETFTNPKRYAGHRSQCKRTKANESEMR